MRSRRRCAPPPLAPPHAPPPPSHREGSCLWMKRTVAAFTQRSLVLLSLMTLEDLAVSAVRGPSLWTELSNSLNVVCLRVQLT